MGANHSRSYRSGRPSSGQHFLCGASLAAELVANAGIAPGDVVLEIGGGRGRLTLPLARSAQRVIAVESDAVLCAELRRRFAGHAHVSVVQADILDVPFPTEPFRAFGNVPFALTTPILRRLLDDPASYLARADLVLQFEAARKRASIWPSTLLSLGWLPWWEFRLVRHLHASAFDPPPSVDGGVLAVTRRGRALLPVEHCEEYRSMLGAAFRRANLPVHRALRGVVPSAVFKHAEREHGLPSRATARDLDVFDWASLFSMARE